MGTDRGSKFAVCASGAAFSPGTRELRVHARRRSLRADRRIPANEWNHASGKPGAAAGQSREHEQLEGLTAALRGGTGAADSFLQSTAKAKWWRGLKALTMSILGPWSSNSRWRLVAVACR